MNEAELSENWQVKVGGQIYEAPFAELEHWIYEGSLQRKDLVRRGSLRWIEAGRVPHLIKFFNRKDDPAAPQIVITKQELPSLEADSHLHVSGDAINFQTKNNARQSNYREFSNFDQSLSNFNALHRTEQPNDSGNHAHNVPQAEFCALHNDAPSVFVCETCQNGFCKTCPKSYGGTVKICPLCGAMCKSLKDARANFQRMQHINAGISGKFGLEDFAQSLAYPFKFKTSLIFGAIFFVFFSFGQSGAAFGGGMMMFAALVCLLGTNMLSFGILANTLENFSQGSIDRDFMPDFDSFSMWDDVIHPFFLSIGVYLISFGLFAVILIGGAWFAFNQISREAHDTAIKQAARVNQIKQQTTAAELTQPEAMTAESVEKSHGADKDKIQKLLAEREKNDAADNNDFQSPPNPAIFRSLTKFAVPFGLALLISFLWGIFYFPAACAVAGYTRSFAAVMNLSVGFDTIKRLGADYFKILGMVFLLTVVIGVVSGFLQAVFSPFDVPIVGNIPLKIVSGVFTFYFSIVFACILGFALYKNSHKLELKQR